MSSGRNRSLPELCFPARYLQRAFGLLLSLFILQVFLPDSNAGAVDAETSANERASDQALATQMNILKSGDSAERETAVDAIAGIDDPRAVEALITLVTDQDLSVRRAALEALDGLGEPLGRMVSGTLEGFDEALETLVAADDPRAIEPLVRALGDFWPNRRSAAAQALIMMNDSAAIPLLVKTLETGTEDAKKGAIRILASLDDPQLVEILMSRFDRQGVELRTALIYGLGDLGDSRAVEFLIDKLDDRYADVREAAAYSLGKFDDPRAAERLIGALSDEFISVQKAAAWSVGRLRDERALTPLLRALESPYPDLCVAAAYSLGWLGRKEALQPLIVALADDNADVRAAGAYGLGALGDPGAAEPLLVAMRDEMAGVRERATAAAGKIVDIRLVAGLIENLADESAEVRNTASLALTKSAEPLGRLIFGALNGSQEAVEELAMQNNAGANSILVAALDNPDPQLRRGAAASFRKIADPRASDGLIEMAGGWNIGDRIVAWGTLIKMPQDGPVNVMFAVLKPLARPASLVYFFVLPLLGFAAYKLVAGARGKRAAQMQPSDRAP